MAVCNGSQESGKTPSAALPVNGRLFALDLFLTPDYFFLSANQLTAGLIVHRSASSFPANLLQLTIFDNDWNRASPSPKKMRRTIVVIGLRCSLFLTTIQLSRSLSKTVS